MFQKTSIFLTATGSKLFGHALGWELVAARGTVSPKNVLFLATINIDNIAVFL